MTMFFQAAFVIVALVLTAMVLLQTGRSRGVSSILGGSGGDTVFGPKTADVLTWATSIVFGIFLVLAITLHLAR